MEKGRSSVNRRTAFVLSAAMTIALTATTTAQAESVLTPHMRDEVRAGTAQPTAQLSGTQTLSLDIVLPLSDPAGLDSFLADIYNPASPNFHHFLTAEEFSAKFGPTQADYDTVVAYAKSNGLQVTGGSLEGMDIQVRGTVAAV